MSAALAASADRPPVRAPHRPPFQKEMTMTKNQPTVPAWAENLRPGTIVLFRFPERDDDLAGKRRPCLVLGTRPGPNGPQIALAYGTSVDNQANRGFDINVEADDCASVGTHRPTRFVLARRITVGVDDPRFDISTEDNPIVGQLPPPHLGQLRALAGFLGDRVFEDAMPRPYRKPTCKRRPHRPEQDQAQSTSDHRMISAPDRRPVQALARTVSDRREITTPPRRSRGARDKSKHTVIVEHRRKRMPRPISAAA